MQLDSVPVPISVIAPILVFFLSHLGLAVWFASKMSTKVSQITASISEMTNDIKHMSDMDSKILLLNHRLSRAEEDLREITKAAAPYNKAQH